MKRTERILSFMALGRVRDADGAGVWDGAEVESADRGSGQKSETLIHSTHIHTQPRSDGATPEERRQAEASRECAVTAVSKRRWWNCRVLHRLGLP
jgi:hypothetical protein